MASIAPPAVRREELDALLTPDGTPCLSFYAPMVKAGPEVRQNSIRFHNLVRKANEALERRDVRPLERERLLEPLNALVRDEAFWLHQSAGLAVMRTPNRMYRFLLDTPVEELLCVGERFYVTPLIAEAASDEGRFRILALSHDDVRLYDADRRGFRRRELPPGVPTNMVQALGQQTIGPTNYYHGNFRQPGDHGPGAGGNLYHAQGYAATAPKRELHKFFELLEGGLFDLIQDKDVPVVIAAVEYLQPIYRGVTKFPNVVDEGVVGNPDEMGEPAVYDAARAIMEPWFARVEARDLERYPVLAARGKATSALQDVLSAAADGRVFELLLARGAHQWGSFDPQTRRVIVEDAPRGDDLLDLAAVYTYQGRGAVHLIDPARMPERGASAAALFRY